MIRGGDGNAGFAVRHPNGQIVKPYQWLPSSDYSEQTSTGGYYAVCLDNQFSRFASKLVNIYITVIKYDEWDKYAKEIEALNLDIQNFTVSCKYILQTHWVWWATILFSLITNWYLQTAINTVERNVNDMFQYQSHSRSLEARDLALISDNNNYVQTWSIAQIIVIFITTAVQVCSLRVIQRLTFDGIILIDCLFHLLFTRYSLCANYSTSNPADTHERGHRQLLFLIIYHSKCVGWHVTGVCLIFLLLMTTPI